MSKDDARHGVTSDTLLSVAMLRLMVRCLARFAEGFQTVYERIEQRQAEVGATLASV